MYKSHYSIATSTNTTTAAVDSLLARKIDNATAGLRPFLAKALCRLSEDNAGTITDYIQSLKEEINASNNYRRNVFAILCSFSEYNNKPFRQITREDILAFLDSFRRPESIDPQHKWIGTYNLYRVNLIRFFKWFFYPQIEPNKRANPKLLDNIQRLKRKVYLHTCRHLDCRRRSSIFKVLSF